jgi:hypothetical protein
MDEKIPMKKSCFTEGQIMGVLRQAEGGTRPIYMPFRREAAILSLMRSPVVAHLADRDKEADWTPDAVRDGLQLCVHAALGPPDQTSRPPFFTRRLVAERCVLR